MDARRRPRRRLSASASCASRHEQNLVLPHVANAICRRCGRRSTALGLADANVGLITDIIACPGLDYCALANARSIPVAQELTRALRQSSTRQHDIGDLKIKISGCINACGHHHVGHIGILGVEKNGEEFYQITLGGSADENAALGDMIGPAVRVRRGRRRRRGVVEAYLELRERPESVPRHLAPRRRAVQGARLCHSLRTARSPPTALSGRR